jgi:hypothetical protein
MARGGYRPGAGRPRKYAADAEITGGPEDLSPLSYMLTVMNDAAADPARRDRMAVSAAPYCHPRADAIGKKAEAAKAARHAGIGTEWENDLILAGRVDWGDDLQ